MNTFWKAAALVSVAASFSAAQDFGQFLAGPSAPPEIASVDEESLAVYESISDTQGPAYEPVAYEQIGDGSGSGPVEFISDEQIDFDVAVAGVSAGDGVLASEAIGSYDSTSWVETGAGYGLPTPELSAMAPSCGASGSCDGSCSGRGLPCGSLCDRSCPCCCGVGTHYSGFYGELLYLRARNAEVAYAVPIDGPIVAPVANPLQLGDYGILDPDYSLGFRAGLNVALDTVSSIDVRYTFFESLTNSAITTAPPLVLRSQVAHPSSASAASDFLSASAQLEVDFDVIDATFRHALVCKELFAASGVLGARYAKLEQQFNSEFVSLGTETVNTDIDFDGAGMRLGIEAQRYSCRHQLNVYANGYASFLAGRFRGSYFQGQSFDPTVVSTEWEAGRIVPILDLELGVGWTSLNGKFRLAGGYMVNAWFNTLTTQEFIRAVQGSNLVDLGQTMTFDGLNARVEYRF